MLTASGSGVKRHGRQIHGLSSIDRMGKVCYSTLHAFLQIFFAKEILSILYLADGLP